MESNEERSERQSLDRRAFIKICSMAAVAVGLPLSAGARFAEAVAAGKRPSVIWLSFQECTGCTESLLRTSHPDLAELILDLISLDYHEALLAPSGHAAERSRREAMDADDGSFILVAEGAIPTNAQYIRNLILAAHGLHDHIVHFFHLSALDWVDVTSALEADPARTAKLAEDLSPWPRNGRREMEGVKARLQKLIDSGQLGIFANGYWGHPAMQLPPEVNLLGVAHYLQALEYQKKANQVVAILGSKTPNIQNLAVGGVANAINLDDADALNMESLYRIKDLLDEVETFVKQVYLPDVIAIASMYPEWFGHGEGVTNYLAVPDLPVGSPPTSYDLPGGTIVGGDLESMELFDGFEDPRFRDHVSECIARSWYEGDWTEHPYDETTEPAYTEFDADGAYSWVKAPRFQGRPMQVGPLAQVLIGYAGGHQATRRWVDHSLELASTLAGRTVTPAMLHSTLGRHLARAVRATVLAEKAQRHWQLLVENIGDGDTEIFTDFEFPAGEQRGFGMHEAPRGTLSHWVIIEDGEIVNYQAVVPSTWNAGPRDDRGQRGPYEAALLGHPVADGESPLEVVRTVHSFDPCLACAIHAFEPGGKELARVKAL